MNLGHTDFRVHNCWNVVCFPAGDGLVTHVPHSAPKMDLEGAGDGIVGKHISTLVIKICVVIYVESCQAF